MPESSSQPQEQLNSKDIDKEVLELLANIAESEDENYTSDFLNLGESVNKSSSAETVASEFSSLSDSSRSASPHAFFSSTSASTKSSNITKKRKKHSESNSLSPEDKKELRRQKNVLSAAKSRKTTKEKISRLTQENQELCAENQDLKAKLKKLEELLEVNPVSTFSAV